jgi:nucleotide-binding universal stress UspA family protein
MKVLLATDGSEFSERAARFLTRFDFSSNDEIIVLHVVSEIPYDDDHHARIRKYIRRVAPQILKSSARILKPLKAKIRGMEEEGYPDISIVEIAVASGVDLIVTGARGLTGVQLFFLGSITRSVAIQSPIPLLVVKQPPWQSNGNMKVLFATDGSEVSLSTADALTSLPLPGTTELELFTVSWSAFSDVPERFSVEINDRIKGDIARAKALEYHDAEKILESTRSRLERTFSGISELIRIGDPSTEILKESELYEADITVIGCRGLKGIKGMLGSVSRRVLGHSANSVLVGKAAAE